MQLSSSVGYLFAPVLGFLIAQAIKVMLMRGANPNWRQWFRSGSMPSSHSAVVFGLASVIYFNEGFSDLFAVAATLLMITIYDSVMARRSVGEQGMALLRLLEKSPFAKDPRPRVALGHTPAEVLVGSLIGILVGLGVALLITN